MWFKLVIERNILATQKDEAKRNNVPWTEFTYISEQMHRVGPFSTYNDPVLFLCLA